MRWNEMTAPEFSAAVEKSGGVCLLPLGVMEKHGDHLPLGVDYMKAGAYADLAAELAGLPHENEGGFSKS
jgi:creatinine amidohydrolase